MEKYSERRVSRNIWLLGAAVLSIFGYSLADHNSRPSNDKVEAAVSFYPPQTEPSTTTSTTLDPKAAHEQMYEAIAAQANADGKYDRLAHCETQGNWHMRGSRYSGGVGFANTTWSTYRDPEFMPANAGNATKAEQIVVAEYVVHHVPPYGSWRGGKWGCAPAAGLP